jgi:hypothetical protein
MNPIRRILGLCVHSYEARAVDQVTRTFHFGGRGSTQLTKVLKVCPKCGSTKVVELPGWWDLEQLEHQEN